ncbi:YIP1 family protein [Oceanibium sediminis]|uniref:YIP1 family protein n=1 Tax=Oceanibium sediminis TaxID=2026339 RepID=UPI0013002AD7|nr:YIP1 family protein [Oceanibium sediminis]
MTENFSEATAILHGGGRLEENRAGLGDRIVDAWVDMRRSTRRLIEEKPSEHRLLFYVLLSDMIFFLSWSLKTVIAPVSGVQAQVPLEIAAWLIAALMLRTASMYAFSAVITVCARMSGGTGSWRDNRAGIFWGALVAAPFGLLMAVVTVAMSFLEPVYPIFREDWVALPPYWISLVPFIWFISQGMAEANGFKKNSVSFLVMSGIALSAMLIAMFLRSAGIL